MVCEGDSVSLLGLLRFNLSSGAWEVDSPVAMLKGDQGKAALLNELWWDKLWTFCSILARGTVFYFAVYGFAYCAFSLGKRVHQLVQERLRVRLVQYDRDHRIEGAPEFVREGVDVIEIESYQCVECREEARNIVFIPCKDCYLCEKCYRDKKVDKSKCDRCH